MSKQFDFLEEMDEQHSFRITDSSRRGRHGFVRPISPQFERAKVARPAPVATDSPAVAASPPEAIPAPLVPQAPPAVPRVITTRDDLVDLIRRRRDELGITHETIDHLTGWASGYASKVLSPEPLKNLGAKGLSLVLEALALGIVRVEFVEDPEQAARMRPRWVRRLRPHMRTRRTRGALLAERQQQMLTSTTENTDVETPPKLSPEG